MGIFSSKAKFDLERHLQNVVGRCCEEMPEKEKKTNCWDVLSAMKETKGMPNGIFFLAASFVLIKTREENL